MNTPIKTATPPASQAAPQTEHLPPPNEFTIAEHLRVQREIEARAKRFWLASGCTLKSALDDWLLAEGKVLAEFVKSRNQCQAGEPVPKHELQTKSGPASYFPPATLH